MAVIELVDRNKEARNVDKPKKVEEKNKDQEVKTDPQSKKK